MDELLLYAPWVLSAGALVLGGLARRAASGATARAVELERAITALRTPVPPPFSVVASAAVVRSGAGSADPLAGPCPAVLEERLGALEARLAALATTVSDAAIPVPDDVAPMRPPVPSAVEPVAAPRSGWRMFP